ncbi:MAG: hypothetical protein UT17_C0010G0005 [Candidatus Woesebacteria bacterium GW2011_GWB1_39_10]|uniref:HIT domain-containing protein n=1 Tax=Candidatus Woesebacteria bacterium GW2011_GWB1_39_10 TaxID=1618572 RepID=A0A0G0PPT7_9BACT|nr:MAG: hypothetical protein UT17_C0010G0005 [Candidatus Woesebacteria bacterium GW2011_GWB1_39_10]
MTHEIFKKTLFRLARSNASGLFIGFAFENMSNLIPVKKVSDDDKVIVFYHPVKHWEQHLLIVPKKSIRRFLSLNLDDSESRELLLSIYKTATETATKQGMHKYTILVNGGEYQDVPQVHFHLASGKDKTGKVLGQEKYKGLDENGVIFESKYIYVQEERGPDGKISIVFSPKEQIAPIGDLNFDDEKVRLVLTDLMRTSQQIIRRLNPKGYTLLTNQGVGKKLSFHLLYE